MSNVLYGFIQHNQASQAIIQRRTDLDPNRQEHQPPAATIKNLIIEIKDRESGRNFVDEQIVTRCVLLQRVIIITFIHVGRHEPSQDSTPLS
jgi:hypothetical protein